MIVPLFVGREKSVLALEETMKNDKHILLVTQKDAATDEPGPDDIFRIGTVGSVLQLLKLPDGAVKVLVEGQSRAEILAYTERSEFFETAARDIPESVHGDPQNCPRWSAPWSRISRTT